MRRDPDGGLAPPDLEVTSAGVTLSRAAAWICGKAGGAVPVNVVADDENTTRLPPAVIDGWRLGASGSVPSGIPVIRVTVCSCRSTT